MGGIIVTYKVLYSVDKSLSTAIEKLEKQVTQYLNWGWVLHEKVAISTKPDTGSYIVSQTVIKRTP